MGRQNITPSTLSTKIYMLYGYKGDFTHSCAPRVVADTVWERRKIEGEILLKKIAAKLVLAT